MYKEEKVIRRSATASEKKAIIDFLDSINANPITIAQAEDIKVEEDSKIKRFKDFLIQIITLASNHCMKTRDCRSCIFENADINCSSVQMSELLDYIKSL